MSSKNEKKKKNNISKKETKKENKKVVKEEVVVNSEIKKEKSNHKFYFSYSARTVFNTLLLLIFFGLTLFFLFKTVNVFDSVTINYQENSDLDYKVYLKKNNFYEDEYLEKDMIYVANLIDKIVIDYKYFFNIDQKTDIDFTYDIVAKLSIIDDAEQKVYYSKDYNLVTNKQYKMINGSVYNLNEQVAIDYDYYNSLANNFRKAYGINATSNLVVSLKINKVNGENADIKLNNDSVMLISIPLSEKAVNIEMQYNEINTSSYLAKERTISVGSSFSILLTIISLIITLLLAVKLVRLLSLLISKKSIYDKYINKILIDYDRLIVENFSGPQLDNANVIEIKKFEELLDVRDNLKLPILYYNVSKHLKSYFYIKHENDIYLMVIKAVDLEREKNDEK